MSTQINPYQPPGSVSPFVYSGEFSTLPVPFYGSLILEEYLAVEGLTSSAKKRLGKMAGWIYMNAAAVLATTSAK